MNLRKLGYIILMGMALLTIASCSKEESKQLNAAEKEATGLADSLRNADELQRWMKSYERQNELRAALIMRQMYGKVLRDGSEFEAAIAQHDTCINEAKRLKDTLQLIIAMNHQATNFRRMGDMQSAADLHYAALELSDEFSDQESEVAQKNKVRALNGLGNVLLSLENYEAAETVFERALEGERRLKSETGQAINLANLGSIKEKQGYPDSARIYYEQSMELNRKVDNQVGIALCYHYLGHLAMKEGNTEDAINHFRLSYNTALPTGDVWHWLEACNALAETFLNDSKADSAAKYVDLSLESALKINSNEHKAEAYSLRSQLNEMKGNTGQALHDLRLSLAFTDSVENETNENHVQNLRVNYEAKRRVIEVEEAETRVTYEKTIRKILTWSIVIVIILVIIACVIQYHAVKTRKKAADTLKRANQQLLRASLERQQLYRNITHQLRTPLTVVIGMVNQLKSHIDPDDVQGQNELAATQRQSRELLELTSHLIKMSKQGNDSLLSDLSNVADLVKENEMENGKESEVDSKKKGEVQFETSGTLADATREMDNLGSNNAEPAKSKAATYRNSITEGAHVLIAEDNEDVAMLIQNIFQNNGYVTHYAKDGQEALEMLQLNELPDIVISDIAMPRMDGLELIRQIRNDDTMNHLPIIVVSARVEDSERLEGLDAGAEVYLAKPFIVEELLLRAQKLLEQRALLRRRFSDKHESELLMQNLANEEKAFFTQLNNTIDANISDSTLTSSVLAEALCMSRSQLNRKVKNLTGDDTSHYIRNRRLMLASHLLVTTTMPIGSIETECGFDTPGYFSRTFRSTYNMSPSEYRKETRKNLGQN